jgi:hypothetical protein
VTRAIRSPAPWIRAVCTSGTCPMSHDPPRYPSHVAVLWRTDAPALKASRDAIVLHPTGWAWRRRAPGFRATHRVGAATAWSGHGSDASARKRSRQSVGAVSKAVDWPCLRGKGSRSAQVVSERNPSRTASRAGDSDGSSARFRRWIIDGRVTGRLRNDFRSAFGLGRSLRRSTQSGSPDGRIFHSGHSYWTGGLLRRHGPGEASCRINVVVEPLVWLTMR